MIYIIAPKKADPQQILAAKEMMRNFGRPIIKAYWDGGRYIALEGAAKIAAAHELGLNPIIDEVDSEEVVDHDCIEVASNRVKDVIDYITCFPIANEDDLGDEYYGFSGKYYYDFADNAAIIPYIPPPRRPLTH